MYRVSGISIMVAALALTLGVVPSWAQRPPSNDVSDSQSNTGGGTSALQKNMTGKANTAYGQNALLNNTTGGANTAFGAGALGSNTTNDGNTAVGTNALAFTNSGGNTAVGFNALLFDTRAQEQHYWLAQHSRWNRRTPWQQTGQL